MKTNKHDVFLTKCMFLVEGGNWPTILWMILTGCDGICNLSVFRQTTGPLRDRRQAPAKRKRRCVWAGKCYYNKRENRLGSELPLSL